MAQVGRHPGGVRDVVQGELSDGRVDLEKEGQGLADATRRSQHGYLGIALEQA